MDVDGTMQLVVTRLLETGRRDLLWRYALHLYRDDDLDGLRRLTRMLETMETEAARKRFDAALAAFNANDSLDDPEALARYLELIEALAGPRTRAAAIQDIARLAQERGGQKE